MMKREDMQATWVMAASHFVGACRGDVAQSLNSDINTTGGT